MERIHYCEEADSINWDDFDLSVDVKHLLKNIEFPKLVDAARGGFDALRDFFREEFFKRDKVDKMQHLRRYAYESYEMDSARFAKEVEAVLKETGYL